MVYIMKGLTFHPCTYASMSSSLSSVLRASIPTYIIIIIIIIIIITIINIIIVIIKR